MKKILDWNRYLRLAEQVSAEGIVMLKNENSALPLNMDETVSVFGRIQLNYYKSGTGSGGMVNVSKVIGITDGLLDAGVKLNEELLDIYREWVIENPYDVGVGWGEEPWSQKEMPLNWEIVEAASEKGSTAIVIIGRTAGEEQDARLEAGSYLLTDTEKDMLTMVRHAFKKVIVLLNVGGLIDLEFIEELKVDSILYVWQGGMVGGAGVADVLTGKVSPCGKLPDTIAYKISDYPSDSNFGDKDRNYYKEDIYVGYRYFDLFAPNRVRYPFGFGLSYTSFDIMVEEILSNESTDCAEENFCFNITVKNTGNYIGKETVLIYAEQPQGKLGKPKKVLCGFQKTKALNPGESQLISITVPFSSVSSYDDSAATGHKSCFVLEKGKYTFVVDGGKKHNSYTVNLDETKVVEKCSQALAPVEKFERIRPLLTEKGYKAVYEAVSLSETDEQKRHVSHIPNEIEYTGDCGIKLADVYSGRNTMDEFIAQLSDEELSCIIRGEGMGSPRVTAGTASSFGAVADCLEKYGIPSACCSDGPSGMRLDCGTKAFSLPNGTMIASTFNTELVEELFECLGLEMTANRVDVLLGPGINIHRHPLNGRNFEYFSEDPYLAGIMASAELKGLHKSGVTGTLKHFCANNQETNRNFLDSAVSERALREIYLKPFEIAVKLGNADSIMTSYGSVNGLWSSGNFDLNTTILRDEWGFKGITMTDWWANINRRGGKPDRVDFSAMAQAQNDLYMVCADGSKNNDNTLEALSSGDLKRSEIQRNAKNICSFLLHTNAFRRLIKAEDDIEIINRPADEMPSEKTVTFYDLDDSLTIDLTGVSSEKGKDYSFGLTVNKNGWYKVEITASSNQSELAQIPLTLFNMGTASASFTWNGTNGELISFSNDLPLFSHFTTIRLYFAQNGLDLISISFERCAQNDRPLKLGEMSYGEK